MDLKWRKQKEAGENCMRGFTICTFQQMLLRRSKQGDGWACSTNKREEKCIQNVGPKTSDGKRPSGRPRKRCVDITTVLRDKVWRAWVEFIWLTIWNHGGVL
jgi:hypothetical protein